MGDGKCLHEQLELYARQSERYEPWKIAHHQAMACRDIEEGIDLGLSILRGIRRRCEVWQRNAALQDEATSWESGRELAGLFRWWLERSRKVLEALDECEKLDFRVDGSDKFRSEFREVALMSLDVDVAKAAIQSLREGEGIPAKRALDELRRQASRAGE